MRARLATQAGPQQLSIYLVGLPIFQLSPSAFEGWVFKERMPRIPAIYLHVPAYSPGIRKKMWGEVTGLRGPLGVERTLLNRSIEIKSGTQTTKTGTSFSLEKHIDRLVKFIFRGKSHVHDV